MIRDITREVTDRKELVLREQEYRYLFDNTQVALIMINKEGIILNINQTGARMCERVPEEMIGLRFTEFIPENDREDALDAFQESYTQAKLQKSNFVDIEPHVTRLNTPRGTRYLRLVPKAIKVMNGDQMVAILHTALDISESYVLQKTLKQQQQQLQKLVDERTEKIQTLQEEMLRDERLTALGRLTSTVSHEIRNPLGTISSSLYIINEQLKGNGFGVGSAVERASRAVRRCDGIIEEMLDFTRPKVLEKRVVDISSWLKKILNDLETAKNVSIISRIEAGLSAQIDVARMHRCLMNILENAMEALGDVDVGAIHMDARMEGDRIEINITDTGPGISRERQKMIFDPLYSTKTNGIGMGLPVCKQVMELHGGSIAIRSKTGMGTTASLRLAALSQD
jgi:PAS domain S-box-containing protein